MIDYPEAEYCDVCEEDITVEEAEDFGGKCEWCYREWELAEPIGEVRS